MNTIDCLFPLAYAGDDWESPVTYFVQSGPGGPAV